MNALAADELGLQDTHFVNPSGLDADGPLFQRVRPGAARRAEPCATTSFREIVATPEIRADGPGAERATTR